MHLPFYKYQGAGNDFVIINCFEESNQIALTESQIERLCDRRFGIGADGLMLLKPHSTYDFEMIYYNADGKLSSMCGNGGRCIVALAHKLNFIGDQTCFLAVDGPHQAKVIRPEWIELQMQDVQVIETGNDYFYMDTGSPHYVAFVENVAAINVFEEGQKVRYSTRFEKEGTNVNFISGDQNGVEIATYERGVEDETLACGTGITAAAITIIKKQNKAGRYQIPVKAKGGLLRVHLQFDGTTFTNIWLCGPAELAFEGNVRL